MSARSNDPEKAPSAAFHDAFVASMPASYRTIFDEDAKRAHSAVVQRRGGSATRVELWRQLPERTAAVCVVADDAPGLLSCISAALVAHDMDVIAAQAYCRTLADTSLEAVDFFWIRRVPTAGGTVPLIRERDVAAIGETLDALVRGRASFDEAVRFASAAKRGQ